MDTYNRLNKVINEAAEIDTNTKYASDAAKNAYGMDDKMAELAQTAYQYGNAYIKDEESLQKGYDAYWELWKYQVDNNLPEDVFYDLSADFAWDDRLRQEMVKRAKADNREDLLQDEVL